MRTCFILLVSLLLCACGGGNTDNQVMSEARAKGLSRKQWQLERLIEVQCYGDSTPKAKIAGIADKLCESSAALKRRPTEAELDAWLRAARPDGPEAHMSPGEAKLVIDAVGWVVLLRDQATFDRLFDPHKQDYAALRERLAKEAPTNADADEELTRFVIGRLGEAMPARNTP